MHHTIRRLMTLPVALSLMAMSTFDSCSDDPSPGIQGSLTITSGNEQTGPVGSTLSQRLVVQFLAVNENTDELGDVAVEWEVLTGGGSITDADNATLSNGRAGATWILGSQPGPQTVRASLPDSDPFLGVTFTATATGQASCANPFVIEDDFSEDRSWDDTIVLGTNDVTATVSLEATGGNPGGYRRMVHHFPQLENEVSLAVHHIYIEDGSYVPVEQGAINRLRVTEHRIKLAPTGSSQIGTGFIVRKNDVDHIALLTDGVFGNEAWGSITVDLVGSDFTPPVDFSTGAFQFGYLRSNTSSGPIDLVHGIDNWKVEVCRLALAPGR